MLREAPERQRTEAGAYLYPWLREAGARPRLRLTPQETASKPEGEGEEEKEEVRITGIGTIGRPRASIRGAATRISAMQREKQVESRTRRNDSHSTSGSLGERPRRISGGNSHAHDA